MRILQLIPVLDSYRCFLSELCDRLEAEGHEIRVLCRTDVALLGDTGVSASTDARVHHLALARDGQPLAHLNAARLLRREIREWKPDLIHAHFSAAILTLALARGGRTAFPRCIGTFQGLLFPTLHGKRRWLLRMAERVAASGMDRAIVLTADDAEALRSVAPRADVLVQNAWGFGCSDSFVDTPHPTKVKREALRASLDLPEDSIILSYVGRQVAFKGFATLLRGFCKAHATRMDLFLLLIGEQDPLHPDGLTDHERVAMHAHPAIRFAGAQADVLPWLDASDAFVFPATREGMPVGMMEAMARRLPVCTNPVRGCRELLESGDYGRFFVSATSEGVAETLLTIHPVRHSEPVQHLKRSHWIEETLTCYASL